MPEEPEEPEDVVLEVHDSTLGQTADDESEQEDG